jgi:hypothetical protein
MRRKRPKSGKRNGANAGRAARGEAAALRRFKALMKKNSGKLKFLGER